jgi:hypothetical protein
LFFNRNYSEKYTDLARGLLHGGASNRLRRYRLLDSPPTKPTPGALVAAAGAPDSCEKSHTHCYPSRRPGDYTLSPGSESSYAGNAPDAGDNPDYQDWRVAVYDALLDSGMDSEAEKWLQCNQNHAVYFVSPNAMVAEDVTGVYCCSNEPGHHAEAHRMTCQLRFCPDCAKRQTARLMARYVPHALHLVHNHDSQLRFRKIVLTTPLDLTDPAAASRVRELFRAVPKVFDRLLPSGWKQTQGFIVSAEFGPDGHKLHFHILFYGQWISNLKVEGYPLASAWAAVTGGECEVARIYGVKPENLESEIIETIKYTTKFWKVDETTGEVIRLDPKLMPLLAKVLRGLRRVRNYGVFFRVGKVERPVKRCPVCDAILVRYSPGEWNIYAQTGWAADESVFHLGSDIANKSCFGGYDTSPPARSRGPDNDGLAAKTGQMTLSPAFDPQKQKYE